MIAVDTNLLVYAHRRGVREHRTEQRAIELACQDPLALTAFEHGAAELWAHDRRFVKIPGLRLVHPL